MDLRAMAAVTAAITVERLALTGERVARAIQLEKEAKDLRARSAV
jgi:hypothetical protein